MKLSEELAWRGFVAEHTLNDISDLDKAPRKFYWGVDPSADSMHIGNLAAAMMCACFIRHDYQPFLLVGGATGQIGDPKDNGERDLKSLDEIAHNKAAIRDQMARVVVAPNLTMVDNYDWFSEMNYLAFLREIGKQFSMTQLLDRQFIQARIGDGGSGISYAEFSYTLIQGYDFLYLYREYGVDLQLCGADQLGNCTSGIHLIKRLEGASADAYACPLIIDKVSGRKFGKSEGNAIWLDEKQTSVFDFYQFWLGQADVGVEDYLKFYTLLMPDELTELMAEHEERPSERVAQKRLAYEVTKIVHGEEKAKGVAKVTELLFGGAELSDADFNLLAEFVPALDLGITVVDALVDSGVASSKAEARQLIKSGAVSVGGKKISDDMVVNERAVVKRGKNKFILVR
ncbi:tyrosine--tRNA ligase [Candidatus Saccharibacteria bacterium]|nr:tyrosine--tRNA ligase [Candidatus Saccharibacteria bacterium]